MNALCSFFAACSIYWAVKAVGVDKGERAYCALVSMVNVSTALFWFKKYMKAE